MSSSTVAMFEVFESETVVEPSMEELRLQTNLEPIWYNFTVKMYVPGYVPLPPGKDFTFEAELTIKFHVKQTTNVIQLNSVDLHLPTNPDDYFLFSENAGMDDNAMISEEFGTFKNKITKITVNKRVQKVFFEVEKPLEKDETYFFKFSYSGKISGNRLSGLYWTAYQGSDGKIHHATATDMEPMDARRMVPCFDEPAFKAVWKVQVYHPKGTHAVSNGIEVVENESNDDDNFLFTAFEETPKMSSYLLAIVVSDFEFVEGKTSRDVRFRIWARKEVIDQTKTALEVGIKIFDFYEDYFGIPFSLKKQDMMALPEFYYAGMENWGLATFQEKSLLQSEDNGCLNRTVVGNIAHELAHQWFGNLVTMKWWDNLWLNEAFARLFQFNGLDLVDSKFELADRFVADVVNVALTQDSVTTKHPLILPIQKLEDLEDVFDNISYERGAAFLKMLQQIMGQEHFRNGLHRYLTRHSYSNTDHRDLWTALTEVLPDNVTDWNGKKFNVEEFARKWTEQMGYPTVFVETTDSGVKLTQKRFKIDEDAEDDPRYANPEFGYKWNVPIWYSVDGESQPMAWLDSELEIKLADRKSVIVVNQESNGLYRVKYDGEQYKKIHKLLLENPESIGIHARGRIIDDAFAFAQAGMLPYEQVLEMSKYVTKEKHSLPFELVEKGWDAIKSFFGDEPESEYVRTWTRNLLKARNPQNPNVIANLEASVAKFQKRMDGQKSQVSFPRPQPTYSVASSSVTAQQNSRFAGDSFDRLKTVANPVEKKRILSSLSLSSNSFTLKKLLKLTFDVNDTTIRLQDKATTVRLIGSCPIGRFIYQDYFLDNWEQIYHGLKNEQTILKRVIQSAIRGKTDRRLKEIEGFLKENEATTKNLDVFKHQVQKIKTNIKWMKNNFQKLTKWFQQENEQFAAQQSSSTLNLLKRRISD